MKRVIKHQKKMKNTMYIIFGVFALALFAITRSNPSYASDGLILDDALDIIAGGSIGEEIPEEQPEIDEELVEGEDNEESQDLNDKDLLGEDGELGEKGEEGDEGEENQGEGKQGEELDDTEDNIENNTEGNKENNGEENIEEEDKDNGSNDKIQNEGNDVNEDMHGVTDEKGGETVDGELDNNGQEENKEEKENDIDEKYGFKVEENEGIENNAEMIESHEIYGTGEYDGVKVEVYAQTGLFESGTELTIEPVVEEKLQAVQEVLLSGEVDLVEEQVIAFDITFRDPETQEELQPKDGTVQVKFNYEENESLVQAEENEEQEVKVYHLNDIDEEGEKIEEITGAKLEEVIINEEKSEEENVMVVEANSFSIYTIVQQVKEEGPLAENENQLANFVYGEISIEDPNNPGQGITIMDRNLGAITTGAGTDPTGKSYGYRYQWGNNYGFNSSKTVLDDGYLEYGQINVPEGTTGYYNKKYRTGNPDWMTTNRASLWGGNGVQGPCPEGWHVPSAMEWSHLLEYYVGYYNKKYGSNLQLNGNSYKSISNKDFSSDFSNFFALSYVGMRSNNSSLLSTGTNGYFWSSTLGGNGGYELNISKSSVNSNSQYHTAMGLSVRCFKNGYTPGNLHTITFDYRGGKGSVGYISVVDGGTGQIPLEPTRERSTFSGWYLLGENTPFDFTGTTITGDITLYAKWKCTSGYHENELGGCELDIREVDCVVPSQLVQSGYYIPMKVKNYYVSGDWEEILTCPIGCNYGYFLNNDGECEKLDNTKSGMRYNPEYETITVWGGGLAYTIMDKNVGATTTGYGSDYQNTSQGGYFQRGNNYPFSGNWCPDVTGAQVEIGTIIPGSYNRGLFVNAGYTSWFVKSNDNYSRTCGYNLWGGNSVGYNHEERQGPCPVGFHVPMEGEVEALKNAWMSYHNNEEDSNGSLFARELLLPYQGRMGANTSTKACYQSDKGTYSIIWTSDFTNSRNQSAYSFTVGDSIINKKWTSNSDIIDLFRGLPVRCFQNYVRCTDKQVQVGNQCMYVINFDYGDDKETVQIPMNFKLEEPEQPSKQGYKFWGWYYYDTYHERYQKYTFGQKVDMNTNFLYYSSGYTLYAKWCTDSEYFSEELASCYNPNTDVVVKDPTTNEIIEIINKNWNDLELYFVSNTGEIYHKTIMDRNLGATETYNKKFSSDYYNGANTKSYGYHYQWGNNYGFIDLCDWNNCEIYDPKRSNMSNYTISYSTRILYSPSMYAKKLWSTAENWMDGSSVGSNIRGGAGDTWLNNGNGTLIDRKGPCSSGYHIPSMHEWSNLKNMWEASNSNSNVGVQWSSDLLLPPAGIHYNGNRWESSGGLAGGYWSSSASISANNADSIYFYGSGVTLSGSLNRSTGLPIRCFKNLSNESAINIHMNGGTGAFISFTGNVGSGKFVALGTPSRGKDKFLGWYRDEGLESEVKVGDTVVSDIYAKWEIYEDLELYFLQPNGVLSHYTIMDRNIGAKESYNQNFNTYTINTGSFGYQYQWGNNYGFKPCIALGSNCGLFPGGETYTSSISNVWKNYGASQYSNKVRSRSSNWMYQSTTGDNIWGGGGDTTGSNHDGTLIGSGNDWSILSGRQGPCPDGYYIPSAYDRFLLKNTRGNSTSLSGDGIQWSYDLLLPPAGYRYYYSTVYYQGIDGYYWSSSPSVSYSGDAYFNYFYSSDIDPQSYSYRSHGMSVRCAKASPNIQDFTAHINGGSAVIAFTGTVGSGRFTSLGIPRRDGSIFIGWYSTPGFQTGTEIEKGDIVVANIYAKWECKLGYKENESNTGCESLGFLDIEYNPNGGFFSGMDVNEVKKIRYSFSGTEIMPVYNIQIPNKTATGETGWMFAGWYTKSGENDDWGEEFDVSNPQATIAYAKWLPFEDLKFDYNGKKIVMMDRNLGAETIASGKYYGNGTYENLNKLGLYYQRGNNYGFKNDGTVATQSEKISGDNYGPGNYYYSNIFIKSSRWTNNRNKNLWGGEYNSNLDIDRQGPCPIGYHIPIQYEWQNLYYGVFYTWKNTTEGQRICSELGGEGKCFSYLFKLPYAGYRKYSDSNVINRGYAAYYRTATSYDTSDKNRALYLNNDHYINQGERFGTNWNWVQGVAMPVRCFKNDKSWKLIFNSNGGIYSQNINTPRYRESYQIFGTPTHHDPHMEFLGWYTTPNYERGTIVTNSQLEGNPLEDTINLYARWECEKGFIKKGNECKGGGTSAVLMDGINFNIALKSLAKGEEVTNYYDVDELIKGFIRADTLSGTANKILITGDNSELPIYAWFDDGIIYYYSEADSIYMNTSSIYMFAYFNGLTGLDLSKFKPNKVKSSMYSIIGHSNNVEYLNLDNWDLSSSPNMSCMFSDANGLKRLSLRNRKIPVVFNDMIGSRNTCLSAPLDLLDVSGWDLSNTSMVRGLFGNLNVKNIIGLDTWNTSNIVNMNNMFGSISNLTGLDLSSFDTSNVTDMAGMFYQSSSLISLDLSSFDTKNVNKMSDMFYGMIGLKTIYASDKFVIDKIINSGDMFTGAISIVGGNGTTYDDNNVDGKYARIDTSTQSGYFTKVYSIHYNLGGGEIEGEKEYYTPLQETYKLPVPQKENYTFIGWTGSNGDELQMEVIIQKGMTGDLEYTANWRENTYKIIFDTDGGNEINPIEIDYNSVIGNLPVPIKECNSFGGWENLPEIMPAHDITLKAIRNYTCSRSSGGGKKSNIDKSSEIHGSADTGTNIKDKVDGDNDENLMENNIQDKDFVSEEGVKDVVISNNSDYTPEQREAYTFAKSNGITTTKSIEKAKMNTSLKRIEMAKMLSYYAINVLGQTPNTEKGVVKFNDVTNKLDKQYDNGVTLAYQLGIMGINMKNNNFRPYDEVTRAEFVTALSRMLYHIEDGKGKMKYYEPHMVKLYNEGIITNTNPKLKEMRGYVMLMLMRSVK